MSRTSSTNDLFRGEMIATEFTAMAFFSQQHATPMDRGDGAEAPSQDIRL